MDHSFGFGGQFRLLQVFTTADCRKGVRAFFAKEALRFTFGVVVYRRQAKRAWRAVEDIFNSDHGAQELSGMEASVS